MNRKAFILVAILLVVTVGCGKSPDPPPVDYQHSLKADGRDDRLKAVRERQKKYGVQP